MPQISLTKIFAAIVGVIVLMHLENIFEFIGNICEWFTRSLRHMRNFPPGAQAAIAYLTIIMVIVIVFKTINKKF
jgi:hypothetical protein